MYTVLLLNLWTFITLKSSNASCFLHNPKHWIIRFVMCKHLTSYIVIIKCRAAYIFLSWRCARLDLALSSWKYRGCIAYRPVQIGRVASTIACLQQVNRDERRGGDAPYWSRTQASSHWHRPNRHTLHINTSVAGSTPFKQDTLSIEVKHALSCNWKQYNGTKALVYEQRMTILYYYYIIIITFD